MNRRQLFAGFFGIAAAFIASKVMPTSDVLQDKMETLMKAKMNRPLNAFSPEVWDKLHWSLPRGLPYEPKFSAPPKLPQFVIDMQRQLEHQRDSEWNALT